jgi:hypothetical protein
MSGANKYTVHTRLAMLENAVTELKKENAELRTHLKGALETAVNDAKNIIHDALAVDFRDLQEAFGVKFSDLAASIHQGVDGKDGAPGPQGPRGDVLIPNESEAQAALKEARLKLAQKHAALIAPIVRRLEFERTHNLKVWNAHTAGHFWRLLKEIEEEISRLEQS